MSLDYPLYEKMKIKSPKAAKYWMIGDMLYYIGLIPSLLLFAFMTLQVKFIEKLNIFLIIPFFIFLGLFFLGMMLKRKSYKIAEKDGIDVKKY